MRDGRFSAEAYYKENRDCTSLLPSRQHHLQPARGLCHALGRSKGRDDYLRVFQRPSTGLETGGGFADLHLSVGHPRVGGQEELSLAHPDLRSLRLEKTGKKSVTVPPKETLSALFTMKTSIVIPTYNNSERLCLTIASLVNQEYDRDNYEIVIIDDGSTDNTSEVVDFWKRFCNLKYFKLPRSGRASARNKGIDESTGNVIIFLDSDMIVEPQFIENHMKSHKEEDVVVIGYRRRFYRGISVNLADIIYDFQLIRQLPAINDERESIYQMCSSNLTLLPVPWIVLYGCNFSVKKQHLMDVGKFDENFQRKWGAEDVELGYRLHKKGLKFILKKDAIGYHIYHETNWRKNIQELSINLDLFHKTHQQLEVELYKDYLDITLESYCKSLPDFFKLSTQNLTPDYSLPRYAKVVQWFQKHSSGNTLIIGCGDGWLLDKLDGNVGFDISEEDLKTAITRFPGKEFRKVLGSHIPFEDATFDIVVITDFVWHLSKNKFKQILKESVRVGKRVLLCKLINREENHQEKLSLNREWEIKKNTLAALCSDFHPDAYEVVENRENHLLTLIIRSTNRKKSPSFQDVRINVNLDGFEEPQLLYCLKELAIALQEFGCQVSCQAQRPGVEDRTHHVERGILTVTQEEVINLLRQKNIDYVRDEYFQVPGSVIFIGKIIEILDYAHNYNFAFENTEEINQTYDILWCPSRHVLENFIKQGGEKQKAFIVPFGVNLQIFHPNVPPKSFDTDKKFKFLAMGWPRKTNGFDILIEAFTEEFCSDEDVCLIIKTPLLRPHLYDNPQRNLTANKKARMAAHNNYLLMKANIEEWCFQAKQKKGDDCPEIRIISENEAKIETLASYYTGCDCYVQPLRGDAFGLNILEAMACGKPVIVTNFGGHLDFCNEHNSYLIDYQLTTAVESDEEKSEFLRWAEPDKQHLRQLMRYVYENPEKAREVGLQAHQEVSKNWTWENAARKAAESILSLERDGKKAETLDTSRPEKTDKFRVSDFEPKELYEAFRHFVAED